MKLEKVIARPAHKVVYQCGDVVVKLFDASYSKADVLNEALNQARVEQTSLHIPRVRGVESFDGLWGVVSDYIEGLTLSQLVEQNPERAEEALSLFVDLQRQVHGTVCPMLGRLKDKLNWKITHSALDAETRFALHVRLEEMPTHTKLCHGEYNARNIVVATDGAPYLLDWAHACQGNASADVALTYLLFLLKGERDRAEAYLELYCKRGGVHRQYVARWIPIMAACELLRNRPGTAEKLTVWARTVLDPRESPI